VRAAQWSSYGGGTLSQTHLLPKLQRQNAVVHTVNKIPKSFIQIETYVVGTS